MSRHKHGKAPEALDRRLEAGAKIKLLSRGTHVRIWEALVTLEGLAAEIGYFSFVRILMLNV